MERQIRLDCKKLKRGTRWGNILIPRLRQYCASRWNGSFNRCMSDEDLFAFVFSISDGRDADKETVRVLSRDHYEKWVNGDDAPEYMCTWLRVALKDRDHSPFLK